MHHFPARLFTTTTSPNFLSRIRPIRAFIPKPGHTTPDLQDVIKAENEYRRKVKKPLLPPIRLPHNPGKRGHAQALKEWFNKLPKDQRDSLHERMFQNQRMVSLWRFLWYQLFEKK